MSEAKKISVRFFALLREQAGVSTAEFHTRAQTPAELYQELSASHRLTLPASQLRVAVNDRYATMETPLQPNDRVVFIPPVAGG